MLSTKRYQGIPSPLPGALILAAVMTTGLYQRTEVPGPPFRAADAVSGRMAALSDKLHGAYGRLPLYFEANRGQTDKQVKFLSRGPDYRLSLTPTEAVLALGAPPQNGSASKSAIVRMRLVGANPKPDMAGVGVLTARANYVFGKDRQKWHTNIPTYGKVRYAGVYPGVDLIYHGGGGQLEYDFVVAAGANPNRIQLAFPGAQKLEIDAAGALVVNTVAGDIRQPGPHIYQEINGKRRDIPGGYALGGAQQVGFRLGAYDHSRPLVIDPVLAYSTFLGGTGDEAGLGIAADGQGNAYVSGTRPSVRYPASVDYDAFVAKFSPTGALLWITDVGDVGDDQGRGLAVDAAGNAYVTGQIGFEWFGMTLRPGVLLAKLSPTGQGVYLDTFGSQYGGDTGTVVAVDGAGNAYVGGETVSSDFPTTPGAFQRQFASTIWGGDGFITKVNAAGTAMIYSTFLGGSDFESMNGIAVDAAGNVYVTGNTSSKDFPITPGAFQTAHSGGVLDNNGFVSKLSADGSHLVYSTFLGGKWTTSARGIAVDAAGNAYVTGETQSDDFPTTPGTVQPNPGDDRNCWLDICTDAYVTKIAPSGAALVYSTYLGGRLQEGGRAIAVDTAGNAYVTGYTISLDFPTVDPFQPNRAPDSRQDAFVAKLNPTASALVYSSYLGGGRVATNDPDEGTDDGLRIALDPAGNVYVTGQTHSSNFPTTPGAYQMVFGGGNGDLLGGPLGDAFVVKIGSAAPAAVLGGIKLAPAAVPGGSAATGTVTLTAPAPANGALVTLASSNTAAATVPATVQFAAGATAATFTITSNAVAANTASTIRAQYGGVTKSAVLTVKAPILAGLSVSPAGITGGASATGTVTLTGATAAGSGGVVVTLASNDTGVARVPASVTIPAGARSAPFTVTTKAQAADAIVALSATYGGVTKSANLTVKAPVPMGLTLAPASVAGGNPVTATVTLTGPTVAATTVTLSSSNTAAATVPTSVTVAAGASIAKFTVTTRAVTATATTTITATRGATSKAATLTVTPAVIGGVSLSPSTIGGGGTSTGTVTLTGTAAVPVTVTLASTKPAVAGVPVSVTIAAGAKTGKFAVPTKPVPADTQVTLSAKAGGVTRSATLTVHAIVLSGLALSPTTVQGGNSTTVTVTLTGAAPANGIVVALRSNNAAVAASPASVTVPAGAKTASASIPTTAVTVTTKVTLSASLDGITRSVALTVTP